MAWMPSKGAALLGTFPVLNKNPFVAGGPIPHFILQGWAWPAIFFGTKNRGCRGPNFFTASVVGSHCFLHLPELY
jgi:hypothetical protein